MKDVTGKGPLFTDYTYYNIGVPINPLLADTPVDLGLGGFLDGSSTKRQIQGSYTEKYRPDRTLWP